MRLLSGVGLAFAAATLVAVKVRRVVVVRVWRVEGMGRPRGRRKGGIVGGGMVSEGRELGVWYFGACWLGLDLRQAVMRDGIFSGIT